MPMYAYRCDVCQQQLDVLRKHDEQYPPTDEEAKPCKPDHVHLWRKMILPPRMARGPGWGGKKGEW